MFDILLAGGWLMVPLLICSVAVIGISFDRYTTLIATKVAPTGLLADTWDALQNGKLDTSAIHKLKSESPLGAIFAAGLNSSRQGREVMRDSMESQASHEIHQLEKYMAPLHMIGQVAPLLGLLGTVIGMINVFTVMVAQGAGNAEVLAGGISQALVTTAAGLIVAIPAMLLHRYFQRRLEYIVVRMERDSATLVDAVHSARKVSVK